jgi:hypothetical protein
MLTEPEVVERAAQPYVAIRARVTMQTIGTVLPEVHPLVFAWLAERDVTPAGHPFWKYNVRLRLWVDPPPGYNDLASDLAMAKVIKAAGMKLLLDIQYSDFWADPQGQTTRWFPPARRSGDSGPPGCWRSSYS